MAGSTSRTVLEIFQTMELGPVGSSGSATAQAWLDQQDASLGLFIDGCVVRPSDARALLTFELKGGVVYSSVSTSEQELNTCCSSSVSAFKSWSHLSCYQRAALMLRFAGVLAQHAQCLCELSELGSAPCSAPSLIRLVQFYSSWAQLRDTLLPDWTPLGVVAVVASDDTSFYSLMLKVLPALAMGNSVIVVPGQSSAPAVLLFAQLFMAVGPPAGVLNVLTGSDVSLGARLAQNNNVSYLSYSGNKQCGTVLLRSTAGMGVPVSVTHSVGSSCPFIIFESADVDSAVDAVMETAFNNNKQIRWLCFVQESLLDVVVSRLQLRLKSMKCVSLSEGERLLVDTAVQQAQQQGAMLLQSCAVPPSGVLYPPTVLCGVAPSSTCVVAPPPGPLLPLMTFRSNTEAVNLGNHSPHGLAASIWTEDLTLGLETAKSLSVGMVWVNSHSVIDPCLPLTAHKGTGTCTDGGREGLYQFLQPSSSSSLLPRSVPVSMDYTTFGGGASLPIIPDESNLSSGLKSYQLFVGGKACKSESGCSVAVRPPGDDGVLAFCADGGRKDVRNAVEAGLKVQPGWMKKSPSARAQSLYSLAKCLESKRRDLQVSISSQTGLSKEEAEKEVESSVARLSNWAAYCDKIQGATLSLPQSGSALSFPEPLGVIGIVLPDKSPLLSMVTVLGAAVATGNAVVMVPSQRYPLPALALIQVLQSSDLPPGLINIISGNKDQLTSALANHSVIKAIWYWGSAEGCQYLQHTCTTPLKTLRLFVQTEAELPDGGQDWSQSDSAHMEELWRNSVQWKSVWIPTA